MLVLSSSVFHDCFKAGRLGNQMFMWAGLISLASRLQRQQPGARIALRSRSDLAASCRAFFAHFNWSRSAAVSFASPQLACEWVRLPHADNREP